MPEYLGQGFAEKLGELAGLEKEEREVVAYGLEYLLSGAAAAALTLLAGLLLGLFAETLAVLICMGVLRLFAGGAHCSARWRCTVTSCAGVLATVALAEAALFLLPAPAWAALCLAWTVAAVFLFAPNNSARAITDPVRRRRLRQRALTVIATASLALLYLAAGGAAPLPALAGSGAAGFAAGALLLSPAGFKLVSFLDRKLALGQSVLKQRR